MLIGIVLLVALLLVLTGCEKNPLYTNLRVCGSYGIPGMMCWEMKGNASEAEVLETDEHGRVLFTYTTKSIITGQKETATVIMQAADSEHVYFYEDLCYCLGAPALDSEEIKALKVQNDWGKDLNYKKTAERSNKISFDLVLITGAPLEYQRVIAAICQCMDIEESQIRDLVLLDASPADHELLWLVIDGEEGPEYYCILAYSDYRIASMPATGTLEDLPLIATFKQENGWLIER